MLYQHIPMSWVMRHCAGIARLGDSVDAMLEQSLIERSFGDDRDRVSLDQFSLLLMNTAHRIEDETYGLSRKAIPAGFSTLASHVMMGCATLEYALATLSRLYRQTTVRFGLIVEGDEAVIVVQTDASAGGRYAQELEELFSIFIFGVAGYFLGRPLPLRAHQTRDPSHAFLGGRHWATFAPVRLASVAGLCIPRAVLNAKRVGQGSDQIYWDMFKPWLAEGESQGGLTVQAPVTQDGLRVDVLAAEAGVSPSTLRRRMKQTDGGFREARRKLVVEASLERLRGSTLTTEEIATELGYADSRSFRRFLKSATGKTPEILRAERPDAAPPLALVRARLKAVALSMTL